jgi:hypothetical protein
MRRHLGAAAAVATILLLGSLAKTQTRGGGDANHRSGGGAYRAEAADHHPEMRMALHHLREAKSELGKSAHDYSGHRAAAMKNTEAAIQHVVEGLSSAGGSQAPVAGMATSAGGSGANAEEHHPEMRKALRHLEEAKRELERSAHHYDGHRLGALKDTESAIHEIIEGLNGEGPARASSTRPAGDANHRPAGAYRSDDGDRSAAMGMALRRLLEAKVELQKSGDGYNGQRAGALQDTESAIHEVAEGLRGEGGNVPAYTPPVAMADPNHWGADQHAEMRMAMNRLLVARRELERAEHEYWGHREPALKHTDSAIHKVMEGLQSAGAVKVVMVQPDANYRTTAAPRVEAGEHHPEMHMAMHHLREAKVELERSAHDFAGHRVAALNSAESAIHEVSEALRGVGQSPAPAPSPTPAAGPVTVSAAAHSGDANHRTGAGARGGPGERHPEMHMALTHLREAKRELERSSHDYEGHRAAALRDAEASIEQIMEGLKADAAAPSPTPKPAGAQPQTPSRRGAPGRGQ